MSAPLNDVAVFDKDLPADVAITSWDKTALPESWADRIDFRRPSDLWQFFRKVALRKVGRVQLPEGLPLNVGIPKYALLEFHNLPNGNYSRNITRGYSKGFDHAMLGEMRRARNALALTLKTCTTVVDVGCGAGRSAQSLHEAGVANVTGLDASPYLLQHAARAFPHLNFVQGLAEDTRLPSARFDGVSVCYLFHEMPPTYSARALDEFSRILKPDGLLGILEPAPEQLTSKPFSLLRRHGWRGLYFWALARFVHEPFVQAWHRCIVDRWLDEHGFELISDTLLFPSRLIVARRRG